jgi:hypothetical protein
MIKWISVLIAASLLAFSTTGCMGVATPAAGALYTGVKWDGGVRGTTGPKRGEACASAFLGLIATGDASVAAAARNGNISDISGTDHESTVILFGLYGRYCTIAYGS